MAKDIVSAYRNICRELRGLEGYEAISRKTLERQHEILFTGKADRLCHMRIDEQIPHYNAAVDDYNETVESIQVLRHAKANMERLIGTMDDVERCIMVLHEQGKSLREIAELTHYSYIHVRKVSAKLRSIQYHTA